MNTLVKIVLSAAVIIGGITLIFVSAKGDVQYYTMVEELMVDPDPWTGKTLKVHGFVLAGSIDERIEDQVTRRNFVIENKGQRLLVLHEGPVPDTFKDLSEVVAEGLLIEKDGVYILEATNLMAKCPSKYEGAESNRNPGQRQSVF